MHRRQIYSFIAVFLAAMALSPAARAQASTDIKTAPYGIYKLDPDHTSITFKINHLGFSHYTGRFDKVESIMVFNNNAPEQSNLDVTIYPNSIDTNNPKLEEELRTDKWLNVITFPRSTFHATRMYRTGPMTGKITGDFTLLGITRPLTLDVTFVGTGVQPMSKRQVLGFSAITTFYRSDYGLSNLLPMLGNEIVLQIETEYDRSE
jgi:polyisoprenoid-binding protein YceI